nr:nucleotidyltransferase domain-containing protein [Propioniciclava soli]
MADALVGVPGVEAVVLGGSRARGTHHEGSDVDLGLYYQRADLDLDALCEQTEAFSDVGRVRVAGPGSWGPWVDGGAWLSVDATPVDWILRNTDRVRTQCERAVQGEFAFHHQPGHPLGFLDVSYAGEIATCVPLADPSGVVATLREGLEPYPRALRTSFIDNLWQAGFLMDAARKGLAKQDSAYVVLCCSTALMFCAHGWHAAAGSWPTNEKGLVVDVARLALDTHDFSVRADHAMRWVGSDDGALGMVIDRVAQIVDDTRSALGTCRET